MFFQPHIYKIAENAVNSIRKVAGEKSNTSVIVSGESGSGKVGFLSQMGDSAYNIY